MTDKLRPRLAARCSACIGRPKDWMQQRFYARFSRRGLSDSTAKMSQTPVAQHGSRPARLLTPCDVSRRPARHAVINLAGLQRRQMLVLWRGTWATRAMGAEEGRAEQGGTRHWAGTCKSNGKRWRVSGRLRGDEDQGRQPAAMLNAARQAGMMLQGQGSERPSGPDD
jgi:hypothetical protein